MGKNCSIVRITSWYPNFNGSHFGLPPSEIHRMTGLPPKIAWTMTYSNRPHFLNIRTNQLWNWNPFSTIFASAIKVDWIRKKILTKNFSLYFRNKYRKPVQWSLHCQKKKQKVGREREREITAKAVLPKCINRGKGQRRRKKSRIMKVWITHWSSQLIFSNKRVSEVRKIEKVKQRMECHHDIYWKKGTPCLGEMETIWKGQGLGYVAELGSPAGLKKKKKRKKELMPWLVIRTLLQS